MTDGTTGDVPPEQSRAIPTAIAAVILLSATSGVVDAVDFTRYGVFVANQTGNLVIIFLGIFGEVAETRIPESATSLIMFTVGVVATVAFRKVMKNGLVARGIGLGIEIVTILLSALLVVNITPGTRSVEVIALLAFGQGVQAVVFTHAMGVAVSTTVINTAIVRSVNEFFQHQPLAGFITIGTPMGYAAGALIGSVFYRVNYWLPLVLAALITASASIVLGRARHRGLDVG